VDGRIVEIGAAGVRRAGSNEKVSIDDRWHIGSCTKSMTATLAAMLIEDGRLRWETTVGETLKNTPKLAAGWQEVTLEQLLQHRGGAPEQPPRDLWAAAGKHSGTPLQQRRDFVSGLLRTAPESKPGERYNYSNQGYSIAGVMIEKVTGRPWEDLIRERLFKPLGMKSAGFGAPSMRGQPLGHEGKRPPLRPKEPGPGDDNPAAIGPAGTVHCSIADFARYAAWHAERGRGEKALLKPESFTRLHQPASGGDYASGWSVAERPWAGGKALTQTGSNTMWYAVIWVAPEKRAAFVATTNAASDTAFAACDEAIAHLIGLTLKGE
jgi:CubicO group peptidase (beta-lactamase class C family)